MQSKGTYEGRTLHALDYRPETWPNDRWPNFSLSLIHISEPTRPY